MMLCLVSDPVSPYWLARCSCLLSEHLCLVAHAYLPAATNHVELLTVSDLYLTNHFKLSTVSDQHVVWHETVKPLS